MMSKSWMFLMASIRSFDSKRCRRLPWSLLLLFFLSCSSVFASSSTRLQRRPPVTTDEKLKARQHLQQIGFDETSDLVEESLDDEETDSWADFKAIVGSVLGFWGGIGGLGTVFLAILVTQRYCCRNTDDDNKAHHK